MFWRCLPTRTYVLDYTVSQLLILLLLFLTTHLKALVLFRQGRHLIMKIDAYHSTNLSEFENQNLNTNKIRTVIHLSRIAMTIFVKYRYIERNSSQTQLLNMMNWKNAGRMHPCAKFNMQQVLARALRHFFGTYCYFPAIPQDGFATNIDEMKTSKFHWDASVGYNRDKTEFICNTVAVTFST